MSAFTFPLRAQYISLLSGVPASLGLPVVGLECCVFAFTGTLLCFALAIFSGAKSNSVDGEGGFISTGFSGVGL